MREHTLGRRLGAVVAAAVVVVALTGGAKAIARHTKVSDEYDQPLWY